jgi:P27 family predicted phage terminase small subunit
VGIGGQGRPSKPTALKILEGDRPSRINTSEPAPAEVEIRVPSWLSPKAKRVWRALAPDLKHRGVLTFWDAELFAQWCHAAVRAREAAAHIAREGEVVTTARGEVKKSPRFQVWRDSTDVMLRIGARFGLSPSDRSQLTLPEVDDDWLNELLS